MRCPASDPGFAEHPIHGLVAQQHLLRQVLPFIKHKRVAIDVGAHIGTWTLPLAKVFKQVVAVEPQSENWACLEENLAGVGNVLVVDCAVGAAVSKGSMARPGDNSGTYHVAPGTETLIVTLDNMMAGLELEAVDFIKLDVEGFEGFALEGATNVLRWFHPVVFFEDNGLGAAHYGPSWTDPKSILREHGYRHRGRIHKNELWLPR